MTDGTEGSAQRASSLRPRCFGEVDPKTAPYIYLYLNLNSVALVRERTIPTERPPPVGELVPTFADRGCHVVSATVPPAVNLCFLDRSRYFLIQVAPQLTSRGSSE